MVLWLFIVNIIFFRVNRFEVIPIDCIQALKNTISAINIKKYPPQKGKDIFYFLGSNFSLKNGK